MTCGTSDQTHHTTGLKITNYESPIRKSYKNENRNEVKVTYRGELLCNKLK